MAEKENIEYAKQQIAALERTILMDT